jgi:uncharacterized protein (DUF1330 family)
MAKAYWVARVEVRDEEGFKPYAAANPAFSANLGDVMSFAAESRNAWKERAIRARW